MADRKVEALLDALTEVWSDVRDLVEREYSSHAENLGPLDRGFDPMAALLAIGKLVAGEELAPEEDPLDPVNMHSNAAVKWDPRENYRLRKHLSEQPYAVRKAFLDEVQPSENIDAIVLCDLMSVHFFHWRVKPGVVLPGDVVAALYAQASACFRMTVAVPVPPYLLRQIRTFFDVSEPTPPASCKIFIGRCSLPHWVYRKRKRE